MKNVFIRFTGFIRKFIPEGFIQAVYNFKPLAMFIRRFMNLAVSEEPEIVTLTGGEVEGLIMELLLKTEKAHWLGGYELILQKAFTKWMQPGMVAYDIGANIGYMSLLMARIAGAEGQVFAFEALPENLKRLHKNRGLNMCIGPVTVISQAVIDKPGEISFFVHASTSMGKAAGSAGRDEEYLEEIVVSATSLDAFVFEEGNPPPDLIKMDIEGGEVMAMPGMKRVLKEYAPMMIIEIHGDQAAEVCWDILIDAGYSLYSLDNDSAEIKSLEDLMWKAHIFARKVA